MSSKRGMSLVSVMVSLAILAVVLTAATSAFISVSKLTRHAGYQTTASNFAEGVMERTLARPFASIRSAEITSGLPSLPQAECHIEVTKPEPGLKRIIVTCSWVEGGKPFSARFSTFAAEGGRR